VLARKAVPEGVIFWNVFDQPDVWERTLDDIEVDLFAGWEAPRPVSA
jgi:hypothetical protein